MVDQADAAVARWIVANDQASLPGGLTLFEEDWHPGVVGLVAARLKDRLHRPVIACAPAEVGADEVRASARSIRGIHIRDILAEVDARRPGLILRFGGHAMAAGLTLHRASIAEFAVVLDAVIRDRAAAELFEPLLYTDGALGAEDYSLGLARELRYAMPWGQGIPEPLFDNSFELDSWRVVGNHHWRLKLRAPGVEQPLEAMMFNAPAGVEPPQRMHAAYQLDINDWNGRESLRLLIRQLASA